MSKPREEGPPFLEPREEGPPFIESWNEGGCLQCGRPRGDSHGHCHCDGCLFDKNISLHEIAQNGYVLIASMDEGHIDYEAFI